MPTMEEINKGLGGVLARGSKRVRPTQFKMSNTRVQPSQFKMSNSRIQSSQYKLSKGLPSALRAVEHGGRAFVPRGTSASSIKRIAAHQEGRLGSRNIAAGRMDMAAGNKRRGGALRKLSR